MKQTGTGFLPVSPTLKKRLASLCVVAYFCASDATVVRSSGNALRARHGKVVNTTVAEAEPSPDPWQGPSRVVNTTVQTAPLQNRTGGTVHLRAAGIDPPPLEERKSAPVLEETHAFEPFGSPRYPDEDPELTWVDLGGHARGKLGHVCEPGGPSKQCGGELVCRQGVCRHCTADRECPSLHHCVQTLDADNVCVHDSKRAWEKVGSDPYHFVCTLLIFFSSMLAAASGAGGGGMFVPLLVFFATMKAETAVPLSQCMIFFSSLCNLIVFVKQRHAAPFEEQPKIDYDCIVLFEPMLVLGVTFGVLLHRMSPQWFLLVLLCITLGVALQRTAAKGIKQREKELENERKAKKSGGDTPPMTPRTANFETKGYFAKIKEITEPKRMHVLGIVAIWLIMFAASFHGLSACTWQFGVYFALLAAALIICTVVAAECIITREPASTKPIDWKQFGSFTYPAVAFGGGLLGGLLGLGGGVIMSPVLLETGMHSESVQATTAVIVFLSSSLATLQFSILNQIVWHYAIWYSTITIVATLLGQFIVERYVRRTGRYSLITLSIAGVLLFSLVALSFVGTKQVMEDVEYGQQMWWSTARLCEGSFGILDVDMKPAQAWPSDMDPMPSKGSGQFYALHR